MFDHRPEAKGGNENSGIVRKSGIASVPPLSPRLRYQAKLGLPFKVVLKLSKVMPKISNATEEETGYPSIIALEASVSGQVQN